MTYLLGAGFLGMLVAAGLAWYYRRRALASEVADTADKSAAEAAEVESRSRTAAEDARNVAVVDGWKAGMDKAKDNKDEKAALDAWNAAGSRLRRPEGRN